MGGSRVGTCLRAPDSELPVVSSSLPCLIFPYPLDLFEVPPWLPVLVALIYRNFSVSFKAVSDNPITHRISPSFKVSHIWAKNGMGSKA